MPKLTYKPKPVPSPTFLVVTKGSKIRSPNSLFIPEPLSETMMVTPSSLLRVVTLIIPPYEPQLFYPMIYHIFLSYGILSSE